MIILKIFYKYLIEKKLKIDENLILLCKKYTKEIKKNCKIILMGGSILVTELFLLN